MKAGELLGSILLAAGVLSSPCGVARTPQINYALNCQGCHLPDGTGSTGKVPNLRGEVAKFLRVAGGREYLVRVPGTATSRLSNVETAELLNWLIREMGPALPSNFRLYTAAEVGLLRPQWLRQAAPVRADLIQRIRESSTR